MIIDRGLFVDNRCRKLFDKTELDKTLRYLNGVCGSAFSDIVRNAPEVYAGFDGEILSDPADKDFVFSVSVQNGGVNGVLGIVHNDDVLLFFEYFSDLVGSGGRIEFDIDTLAVAVVNGNSDGGCRDPHIGTMKDLSRFVDHLFFFFGVAAFHKHVDMRQAV